MGRNRIAPLALLLLLACAERAPGPSSGGSEEVVFDRYSPLSRSEEILRRTLPPLTFRRGQQALAAAGQVLAEQPIDLAKERFSVYVPPGPAPDAGYGLLVFVAPWKQATHPRRWRPPLNRHRLIFVSAAKSGNDAKLIERRLPLALLAYENVRARYPIDPRRVFIAGFSGGSRVAQVAALAYPDVFRGVLLNAGSEPIGGERGVYLPPADLFRLFQTTRVVFITGGDDPGNLEDDQLAQASLREWCVLDVEVQIAWRLGHEALDPDSLDDAFRGLERSAAVDAAALESCNARIQRELGERLGGAEAAIRRGDRDGARERLKAIDGRYGGLSAPAIFALDASAAALK